VFKKIVTVQVPGPHGLNGGFCRGTPPWVPWAGTGACPYSAGSTKAPEQLQKIFLFRFSQHLTADCRLVFIGFF
jgi:hypothetical protein